jgi:hypothetical protein
MTCTKYICLKCKSECDLHEIDEGGYEEFWGAKVWHPVFTSLSDCCHSEYREEEDGTSNNILQTA